MKTGQLLSQLCEVGASFYARGYAFGSTGNLSVRDGDLIWITPTGKSLQALTIDQLACIDIAAISQNQNLPSKEYPFHLVLYRQRPEINAIVHLHAPLSTALSCLKAPEEMPPLTPYYFMRVAPLAVLPYFRPGSVELAAAVEKAAPHHNCIILRNHGTICAGTNLSEAVDRTEELEATARLYFTLRGESVRCLTAAQVTELQHLFGSK